jgi:hypothetical protein
VVAQADEVGPAHVVVHVPDGHKRIWGRCLK